MKLSGQFLEGFFNIRKHELGRVLRMSMYLLLIIASYSITKAVRDSLFVTKIGPRQLPYVYLLIAAAMGIVSLVYSRTVNRIGLHRLIRTTSLVAISNLLFFWFAFKNNSPVWFYVLYVWASLFGAITASQFWLLATHVFNPREARRLFAWIGVGGILGGVLGGGMTVRMAHWFGTESLLLVCAGMMAATVVILERVARECGDCAPGGGEILHAVPGSALLRQVRESRHLTMMVFLLSIAVIVEAFIDYEYKLVARQSIASKDHLTAFFGSITFYIGIFSLLFQLIATNRILKRFGVSLAILVLPAGLFAAFLTLAFRPGLWTAALLQLVDGGFSYSIHRSGMELLYLPIPPQTRNAVKGFIDTFVDRAGRAAGAVLLLLFTTGLALSIPSLSLVAAALVAVWIAMAVAVKREYMHSFRRGLEKTTIEPEALQLRDVDGATMKTLLALLSSDDERQVLYGLDLLSNTHPNRWRRQIEALIHHHSGAVRARTIAVLASWNDPAIAREEFIRHPDYETARIATASALRFQWSNSTRNRELLNRLLHDPSLPVVREAILTAGIVGYAEAVPLLIERLADRHCRREGRQALLKFGESVIPELVRRLSDPATRMEVRERIPKALALTGNQHAADALLDQFHRLDYPLDYLVLKALNRMRANSPEIVTNGALVNAAISNEHEEYDRLKTLRGWLETHRIDHDVFRLLMRALDERLEQRLERIFRLVGLIYSPHEIYSVYYNCHIKPALRPAAIEFLDNLLDKELKETVVPLLEEAFDRERALRVHQPVEYISLEAALSTFVKGSDPWLKAIAADLQMRLGEEHDERTLGRVITH
jgi:AAA family ATP:ADP antiporter